MNSQSNISRIFRRELCCGCGACVEVCPKQIINFGFNPNKGFYSARISSVDEKKCNCCSSCLRMCPINSMLEDSSCEDHFNQCLNCGMSIPSIGKTISKLGDHISVSLSILTRGAFRLSPKPSPIESAPGLKG
jgi:NAD-dependent dihydropyrimidine dehydrogenase PreA subunit